MGFVVKNEDLEEVAEYLNKKMSEWDDNFKDMESKFKALANSDAFKGASADSVKNYILEFHLPLLATFSQLALLVRTKFASYKDGYYQIDNRRDAYITEDALEGVKRQYDNNLRWLYSERDSVNAALLEISDFFDRGWMNIQETELEYTQIIKNADKLKNDIINYENEHNSTAFVEMEELINRLRTLINSQKGTGKIDISTYNKYDVASVSGFKELINSLEVSKENLDASDVELRDGLSDKWNEFSSDIKGRFNEIIANVKGSKIFSCLFSDDPVNLSTGNFIFEKEDLSVDGVMPIKFKRFYNAINNMKGALGCDWCHNYETKLIIANPEESTPKRITFVDEESKEDVFVISEKGKYVPLDNSNITLKADDSGNFIGETLTGYKYIFNSKGQNTRQEDSNENAINLKYIDDKLTSVTNENGEGLTFKYDSNYLKEVTDHSGRKVSFKIDGDDGILKSVTNPLMMTTNYEYTDGKLSGIKNSNDVLAVKNKFDDKYRVEKQEFPDGGEMLYKYDANKTELTEQNGNKITYEHDNKFRSIRSIYSDGEEKFAYNSNNQRTMKIDKLGNCTNIKYDNRGNLTGLIDAEGNKYVITYDSNNKPINIKLNDELKMKNSFDSKGNLVETVDALKRKTSFEYNAMGKPVKITRPDKSVVEMEYDKRGNMILRNDGETQMRCEYDNLNRPIKINDTQYFYNDNSKIEKIVNADGSWEKYKYNGVGKVVEKATSDGTTIKNEYNDMNLLTKITDVKGTTKLEYDNMWNVSKKIDVDGNETTYKYNQLNKLEEVKTPEGELLKLNYDPNGNPIHLEKGDEIIKLKYDGLDRPIEITDPVGVKTHMEYDAINLTRIQNKDMDLKMEYDAVGQLVRQVNVRDDSEANFTYDKMGRLENVFDGKGVPIHKSLITGANIKIDSATDQDNLNAEIEAHYHFGGNTFIKNFDKRGNPEGWSINIGFLHYKHKINGNFEFSFMPNIKIDSDTYKISESGGIAISSDKGVELISVKSLSKEVIKKRLPHTDIDYNADVVGSLTIRESIDKRGSLALFAIIVGYIAVAVYGRGASGSSTGICPMHG